MSRNLILFIIINFIIALIGSAFLLSVVIIRKKEREKNLPDGAVHRALPGKEPFAWKRLFPGAFWFLYYFAIGAVILFQSFHGTPGRGYGDILFLIVPSVFLIIGCVTMHGIQKRRRLATASTVAKVAAVSKVGNDSTPYAPVYEYYVNGIPYKVVSPARYGTSPVRVGDSVELCYAPGQPRTIYVPEYEKRIPFVAALGYLIGTVFPLLALARPLLRG